MRAIVSISVIVLVMAAHVLAQTTPALAQADGRDAWGDLLRQAAAKVAPTVVTIETVGGTQSVAKGSAASMPLAKAGFILADGPTTGLVWSADGLILTSQFNFLRDPSVVTVVLADGRRLVGELLARDEVCGLAMLKVDAANLPVPEWRPDDEPIRVGQTVMALGRGFGGPECSLNVGIVSGLNRMSGLAIQTDARLSPGNFGGPLIDIQGRVLGICVSMSLSDEPIAGVEWYDSGIGFAVPRPLLRVSVESLAVGHSLRRGLFGVRLDSRPNMPLHVRQVADPSPAMRGGMQAGDRILAVGGRPVKSYLDLKRAIRARRAGEWVDVRVRRDGHDVDLRLMLAVSEDIGPLSGEPESQPGFAESVPP